RRGGGGNVIWCRRACVRGARERRARRAVPLPLGAIRWNLPGVGLVAGCKGSRNFLRNVRVSGGADKRSKTAPSYKQEGAAPGLGALVEGSVRLHGARLTTYSKRGFRRVRSGRIDMETLRQDI